MQASTSTTGAASSKASALGGWVGVVLAGRRCLALLLGAMAVAGACDFERREALRALDSRRVSERVAALKVLAREGDGQARARVSQLLTDRSARVRLAAVEALAAMGKSAAIQPLVARLEDPDVKVQLAAARALAKSGSAGARHPLLAKLCDPRRAVRRVARRALEALGVSRREQIAYRARERLDSALRALSSGTTARRVEAVRELAVSGRPRAIAALIAIPADAEPEVLAAVGPALGRVGGARARGALARLARSNDPSGRAAAAVGGARLRPPAWDILQRTMHDRTRSVRIAALRALAAAAPPPDASLGSAVCASLGKTPEDKAGAPESSTSQPTASASQPASGPNEEPASRPSSRPSAPTSAAPSQSPVERAAVRVIERHRISCPSLAKRLTGELRRQLRARDDELSMQKVWLRVRLLAAVAEASEQRAVAAAAVRWLVRTHLRQIRSWVPASYWDSGGAASHPTSLPRRASRQEKLRWVLRRFPERAARSADPLLPPSLPTRVVARAFALTPPRGELVGWIVELTSDLPPELHGAALRALGRIESDQLPAAATAAVKRGLEHDDARVRSAALDACELLGARTVVLVTTRLRDEDFDVRAAAARCLGRLGKRAAKAVPELLVRLQREGQLAVIDALGAIGDRRATSLLLARLGGDHTASQIGERIAVIEALGELGDPAAAGALENELHQPQRSVRLAAARALQHAHRVRSRVALGACRADYAAAVRAACARALRQMAKAGGGTER